jgi:hypothetical protein
MYRVEKNIILERNPAGMQTYEQERMSWKKAVEEGMTLLEVTITEEARHLLENFKTACAEFRDVSDQVANLTLAATSKDENDTAWALSAKEGQPAFAKAEAALQELVQLHEAVNNASMIAADRVATRALQTAQCLQDLIALHRTEKDFILTTSVEEMERYATQITVADRSLRQKLSRISLTIKDEGKHELDAVR